MAVDLPKEFSKYCAETKHLRRILKHTQACFQDINNAGVFEGNQIVSAELSQDEENEITANTKRVPGIVIFGQTNSAKAFVVNEIFNEPILPSSHDTAPWRDVVFKHGAKASLSFVLPNSYELLVAEEHEHQITGPWTTVPLDQLAVEKEEFSVDQAYEHAVLEVKLKHPLLKEGGVVRVARTYDPALGKDGVMDIYSMCTDRVIPVIVYAIAHNLLCEQEVQFLQHLRDLAPRIPIFFIKVPPPRLPPDDDADAKMDTTHHDDGDNNISPTDTPFNRQDVPLAPERETSQDSGLDNSSELDKERYRHSMYFTDKEADAISLFQQLVQLGYLSIMPERRVSGLQSLSCSTDSYGCDSELVEGVANFGAGIVHFTHQVLRTYLLQTISLLILVHERCLQNFIMRAFDMARDMQITPRKLEFAKRKEIELYSSLMEIAVKKQDEIRKIIEVTVEDKRDELLQKAEDYDFIGADILETGEVRSARDLKICTGQIQELVLSALNSAIAGKVLGSVDILKDSYTGVLTRCLESLEQSDAYSAESLHTSLALREILHAAYQVEITVRSGASVVRFLLEKMKQLVAAAMPWSSWPRVDAGFKRRVAGNMLDSLNSARLAASICSQIKEKLKQSHDQFAAALNQLESRHSTRLGQTEEKRMKVRKVFAPRVARLVLESTSLRDYINFDMPALGREVGRGQYGVVYSCEAWAGHSPCAVKSVVPPDDKHWNDLALEFFYTKHVPEHERLVALRGSVIDYTYGSGSAAVLLIMDRLQRDLYTAIRAGLGWINRLQVAIDVVEGIRYLHSQGLVHRDIKLKNVLLDGSERGKLTDLGFCKPEAMMSGSIVGTPIHMAPELFSGKYDNSVDVYAFGILFWYICAGHVKLPYAFEQCANKEMLWTSVKQGVRPEKLSQFSSECWSLMSTCWESESHRRPLVGQVHARLNAIIEKERARKPARVMIPRRRNVKSPTVMLL